VGFDQRSLNSHLDVPEIASEMMIAPTTLRTHIRNIYLKLDVHGRLEALCYLESEETIDSF